MNQSKYISLFCTAVLKNNLKQKLSFLSIVLSGAGISTNAGISDFRGPNGIWTLEERAKKNRKSASRGMRKRNLDDEERRIKTEPHPNKRQRDNSIKCEDRSNVKLPNEVPALRCGNTVLSREQTSFENASPTSTHVAITRLVEIGLIKYVITQNVDGLHRRSGLPREKHAILHGCVFTEKCDKCDKEYFRDYEIHSIGFKKTGRKCEVDGCDGDLRDVVLDWEDKLPVEDLELAQQHCYQSDLVLAIGSSLRIEPGMCKVSIYHHCALLHLSLYDL